VNLPWAELLLAGLRDAGAGDVVVSPGSRSTPLVMAAARLGLRCQVIVDERVAGFFALGQARVTGRPSILVCTSGSAGAHYFPAVVEAAMARVPLVVITADRPPELHHCSAPQTIDQTHLFGRFARGFADLGIPEPALPALRGLRRRAAQMAALTRWPEPGPVHINAPARVPLEPAAEPGPDERRMIDLAAAVAAEPFARQDAAPPAASDGAVAEIAAACRAAVRGLLVAGPAPIDRAEPGAAGAGVAATAAEDAGPYAAAVAALARATGFPVLAEATSQLRWTGAPAMAGLCSAFDLILRGPRRGGLAEPPDLIVEIGAPPTSSAWARYAAEHRSVRRIVIAPHGWPDPHASASLLVAAAPGPTAARVAALLDGSIAAAGAASGWSEAWREADRRARACLERASAGAAGTGEHAAVAAAVGALPDGSILMLGNSLPVRVADAACPAAARRIDVLHQRGACGIDGLIAGAAGAASAARRPTALLLGDVSFAHDVSGLVAARLAGAPLALVVVDNGGGRIFEQLPVANAPGGAELLQRFFLTPQRLDVAAAAGAFGVAYRRAASPAEVAAAVRESLADAGATVVHAPVAPQSARDVERAALSLAAEAAA
jgi:2-succinyl-5-enolpyruvyl-6-hydroxy-3-cyclohexene-1-carboxylate synthase